MEKNRNFRYLAIIVVFATIIFSLYFVWALIAAPTVVTFGQNVSAIYDEGTFTVNWTAGGSTDAEINFSIFIYADDVLYTVAGNDSTAGYSYSNTTSVFEGTNYTFTIQAINFTAAASGGYANSSNISMITDFTAPVITLPQYTNVTVKKNTDDLILNISISDVSSGLTGTLCLVDVNGTNQTIVPSGGTCNSSSVKLTNLADGNRIINVWVNDTVNILGLNNSFVLSMDTTAPVVSLTKLSSGQTSLELTISGEGTCTVDRSGATISGNTLTETSLSCGQSYSYTVTCTDATGNAGSSSATSFSTTGCSSAGTTTSQPKKASYSFTKITPGVATIVKNFDAGVGVKEIKIEVNNEAQSVSISVTKYDGKPAAVSVEKSGKVYKYIQIESTNLADKLSKATVTLQVGKSWLSSNGLDANNVALFRFDEASDQWNELATTYTGSEGDNELYDVELTSFSFFAISEKSSVTGEGAEAGAEGAAADKSGSTLLWVVIAIVVLFLIGWGMKKKKQ